MPRNAWRSSTGPGERDGQAPQILGSSFLLGIASCTRLPRRTWTIKHLYEIVDLLDQNGDDLDKRAGRLLNDQRSNTITDQLGRAKFV